MNNRVLLVEDEPSLSGPLAFLLERDGFEVTVVADGLQAVEVFDAAEFDLVLLDLMLPGMPGTEVCRAIRAEASTPIVMLTAKDSEVDIVVGLELGADDYVTKPYSTRELLARMRAVLRRWDARIGDPTPEHKAAQQPAAVLEISDIALDVQRHSLRVRGNDVLIPLREFELLEYLMLHAGKVLTRAQLIDHIWGANYFGDTKTLDVHIKRIRSRIEVDPANPVLITTVRGVGYRFN